MNNKNLVTLLFRKAKREDVRAIVKMLAQDKLGAARESYGDPLPDVYYETFEAIASDPNQELTVAILGDEVVGLFQLTFLPYLTYQGGWRALIEGVRVSRNFRGQNIGRAMLDHAILRARQRGCHMIQLTTDKRRPGAIRFYERLGFKATHEGMKLHF